MNAGNRGVSDVPTGLIRYWAAAREAAGTAEEPYAAATLADALAAARLRHGPALDRVLARCAFVVDGTPVSRRDPTTVDLSAGGTIEVLPPFAGGAPTGLGAAKSVLTAILTSVVAVALLAASAGGRLELAAALVVVQIALVIGWFRSSALLTRGEASGALAAVAAAIAADVVLLRVHDKTSVRGLAGVLAGLVVLAFVVQLLRRDGRSQMTRSVSASVATGALTVCAAVLLAVRGGPHGTTVVAVAVTAVAVGVLPMQRGLPFWISIPVGLGLGAGAGLLVSSHVGVFGTGTGAVVAVVAVTLAVVVKAALVTVPEGIPIWPVVATLPIVVVAPAVLVVARIMVG